MSSSSSFSRSDIYNKSIRFLKNSIINYTTVEQIFRRVTNSDKHMPNKHTMRKLAKTASHSFPYMHEINTLIMRRFREDRKHYVHIYKTLVVLEFLILNGCECMPQFWRRELQVVKNLTMFEYRTLVADKGKCVRDQAQKVLDLLMSVNRLHFERQMADCYECKKRGLRKLVVQQRTVGSLDPFAACNWTTSEPNMEQVLDASPLRWDDDGNDTGSITDFVFEEKVEKNASDFTLTLMD